MPQEPKSDDSYKFPMTRSDSTMKCGPHRGLPPGTSSQLTHRRGSRLIFRQHECVNMCVRVRV